MKIFKSKSYSLTLLLMCLLFASISVLFAQNDGPAPKREISKIEFLGWDYTKVGYTLNPGEKTSLLFQNNTDKIINFPVKWTLKTYMGDSLTSGSTTLNLKGGTVGEVPFKMPSNIKDGAYMIYYYPVTDGWRDKNLFYFDYRKPTNDNSLNINIVACIENMDTEGWARMMMGPLAKFANITNEFPEDMSTVDVAIVVAEALDIFSPKFAKIQQYLAQGGTIIVYGKTAPILAKLLPVTGSDSKLIKNSPVSLSNLTEGPWKGFKPDVDIFHYPVQVKAKPEAKILAKWSDNSPAVVSGTYKSGKVIYVGTSTYHVWQRNKTLEGADELSLRLIYNAKGGDQAVDAMLNYAQSNYSAIQLNNLSIRNRVLEGTKISKPTDFYVISKNNIGRFGWIVAEGGLTENIGSDGRISTVTTQDWKIQGNAPKASDNTFTYSFSVENDMNPVSKDVRQNWLAKSVDWVYANGEKVVSTLSLGTPAILWEGNSQDISLSRSKITHIAFPTKNGVKVMAAGEKINPLEMKENWLITFIANDSLRDMPQLVVFTKRPASIEIQNGLQLKFGNNGFGAMFTTRLYGIKRLGLGATVKWTQSVPEKVIADASCWSKIVLNYPIDCDEIGWIENNTVKIADKFHYKNFKTDWNTKAMTYSLIPPVYSLAQQVGAPVQLPEGLTDLNCASKFGPLKAVKGNSSVVGITNAPFNHRAIVPVDGQMVLADVINRNVKGLGLNDFKHADGGVRNEGMGRLNADMLPYDNSRNVPFQEAAQIDLYKWWLTFQAMQVRTVYTDSVRKMVDKHFTTRYWETLNFYPHKSLVVQKREPYTSNEYMITFVWPTQTQYGFRNFNDINEASGVNVYCYTNYARYYGDWATIKSNWNLCRELHDFLVRTQDWACMSTGATEIWEVAGLDMINSEAYGSLTFAYAAEKAGFPDDALKGRIMGTRSLIPTVARLGLEEYIASICEPGDPWLVFKSYLHFNEMGIQAGRKKSGSVGWLDTSKGAMHELADGYKSWATKKMTAEQKGIEANGSNSNCDLTQRLLLGWNKDSLLDLSLKGTRSERSRQLNWQNASSLYDMAFLCVGDVPVYLSDWSPAEYISGNYNKDRKEMQLCFQSHQNEPFTVRIYSEFEPLKVHINTELMSDNWKYNPKTSWLEIALQGQDMKKLKIEFGKAVAK